MLLKSVEYDNFRGFRGKHKLDLTCKDNRNVIVVLGDNTHGKSTIVQSFVWCFYGITNFDNPLEIYNRAAAYEMEAKSKITPCVEVIFEHENTIYTARREQEYFKTPDGKMVNVTESKFSLTRVDNETGQTLPCGQLSSELAKAINTIMPRDLAPYFFFEGEKNNELTTKSLSSAVKNLLGIEALAKMREHLHGNSNKIASNSVMGYYEEKQVDLDNSRARIEWDKRVVAENKINELNRRLNEITNEINSYETKMEAINTMLRNAEPTRLLQQRRDQIKKDITNEMAALNNAYSRYIADFNDRAVDLFTIPLLKKAYDKLQKMDLGDKGIRGVEAQAIKDLLKRGECLCGTDLKEGSLAYKNLEKYLDVLPPKNVGILVRALQDSMSQSEANGIEFIDRFTQNYKSVQYSINKINDLEREEKEIFDKLRDSFDVNTAQYEEDLRQYKNRINALRTEEKEKIAARQTQKSIFETADNNYNMYKSKSEKNAEYALYLEYAKRIYDWISNTYDAKEKEIRERLQNAVTEIFNNIYSGNRKVIIDSSYNISVIPKADTGGLKVIQYFSYVGGLVRLAREIMCERHDDELFGEEYPLVLDAAFSHADVNHTKAIAVELSKVTNQLIFAVMDKDWTHVGKELSNKISRTLKLVKLSEHEVTFEEE